MRAQTIKKKIGRRSRAIRKRALASKSTAIVAVKPEAPLDYVRQEALRAPSIQDSVAKMNEIRRFIRRCLKTDIDYGKIPGVNHKFLLQPGAEKIAVWLRVKPVFEIAEAEMAGGHIEIRSRCRLVSMASVLQSAAQMDAVAAERMFTLSEATASCSTMETNFRYRWCDMTDEQGNPIQPSKEETRQLKAVGMGRHVPAELKNGRVVPLDKAKAREMRQKNIAVQYWLWQERKDNPNIHDERNKVRQMAEKRAFVKAIRRMGALSEIFKEDPGEWGDLEQADAGEPAEKFKPGVVEQNEPSPQNARSAQPAPQPATKVSSKPNAARIIYIVWQKGNEVARVSGYTIEIRDKIVREFMAIQTQQIEGKPTTFLMPASHVPGFAQFCQELGYQIQEQDPPKEAKPKEPPANAEEEKGTIKQVKSGQGPKSKYVNVLFNGAWIFCFDTNLQKHLYAGTGKQARLLIQRREGKPPVIVGLLQVGTTEFLDDGKTPCVSTSVHAKGLVE